MSQKTVVIQKAPKDVVVVDSDHGGFLSGHCIACDSSGWIEGFGLPHGSKHNPGSHLVHKKSCPMNSLLTDQGKLKK